MKTTCRKCGRPHETGGYAHPSLCYHCAPVGVTQKKWKRYFQGYRHGGRAAEEKRIKSKIKRTIRDIP